MIDDVSGLVGFRLGPQSVAVVLCVARDDGVTEWVVAGAMGENLEQGDASASPLHFCLSMLCH